MTALALAATGCSSDIPVDNSTPDNKQPDTGISVITATTPAEEPSTRLAYTEGTTSSDPLTVKWAKNSGSSKEQFYAFNVANDTWSGSRFARTDDGDKSQSAKFTSYGISDETTVSLQNGSLQALYPAKEAYKNSFLNPTGSNIQEISLPLAGQTGNLEDMQNFHYMTATVTIGSGSSSNLQFDHRIAILRLSGLTFSGLTGGTATEISISGTGLMTEGRLTLTKATGNTSTNTVAPTGSNGPITTTGNFTIGSDGKLTENVYICFFPNSSGITNLKVTAKVGADTYEYAYTGTVGTGSDPFQEGNMYTLKDAQMTKKPVLQVSLYDLYFEDGTTAPTNESGKTVIGMVIDANGTVLSRDLGEQIWSTATVATGATNTDNGAANMQTLLAFTGNDLTDYPAFKVCYELPAPSGKHWYLPAKYEMEAIIGKKAELNPKLEAAGLGNLINGGDYWTSTEHSTAYAFEIYGDNGSVADAKDAPYYVRAILKLQ